MSKSRLTILRIFKRHQCRWAKCRCVCGKLVCVRCYNLWPVAHTKSCGCLRHETKNGLTHGHRKQNGKPSRTYNSWAQMRARCTQKARKDWNNYGGRGIRVCARWCRFENFLLDMGIRPLNKTLDRRNNMGDYTRANCRWATYRQQARNRRHGITNNTKHTN